MDSGHIQCQRLPGIHEQPLIVTTSENGVFGLADIRRSSFFLKIAITFAPIDLQRSLSQSGVNNDHSNKNNKVMSGSSVARLLTPNFNHAGLGSLLTGP